MYINIRVQWTVHKMAVYFNNMTIIKYLMSWSYYTIAYFKYMC